MFSSTGPLCDEAFANSKNKLSLPILQYPDFEKEFVLTTDASQYGIGSVLSQGEIGSDIPVAYASRTLNKVEQNYSTIERDFRHDEDVSSYCIRLRNLGSKLLKEDLESAQDEVAGLRKKNKDILLNQFKIGLRKDLLRETGILLLKEEQLDLDKAEKLVKLQETTMILTEKIALGR
ncbi:hypothetical protein JTB14_027285 [Gonioctena quinquepunctata]|nr:hypothetical protein JTB14_027285 [Gonioctena quinquepunctata]